MGNGQPDVNVPDQEQSECGFAVQFENPHSLRFRMNVQNISAEQLLFLGAWLTHEAHRLLDETAASKRAQQIVTPRSRQEMDALLKGRPTQ